MNSRGANATLNQLQHSSRQATRASKPLVDRASFGVRRVWRASTLAWLAFLACGGPGERKYESAPGDDVTTATGSGGSLAAASSTKGGTDAVGGDGSGGSGAAANQGSDGSGGSAAGGSAAGGTAAGGSAAGADSGLTTNTTGEPPVLFVPGPPGLDIVAGGARVSSPRFTLVFSAGQSPGGNSVNSSSRYRLASGLSGSAH
jgi:hypothetical protein